MTWRIRLEPILRPLYRYVARRSRPMTLGVRGLVLDADGRVLLIRHTYVKGWYMPGGGVERGETAEQALERELMEEAGIRMTSRGKLLSFHSNHVRFPGDHVLIYRIEAFEAGTPTQAGEIAEIAWFPTNALPEDITPSTRRRIEEALGGEEAHPHW